MEIKHVLTNFSHKLST